MSGKLIDNLAQNGYLELLKLSKETYFKNSKLYYNRATIYAAENGDLEMLKWLKENFHITKEDVKSEILF